MKCVVLGGGGFIGSATSDRLLQEGHHVRIFDRPGVVPHRAFLRGERIEWKTGDFLDARDVAAAVRGMDVVLHLVSTTCPQSSFDDPVHDVLSNVLGTRNVLEAMRSQRVPRIVFISSGGTVYGKPHYLPIDEAHPTEPLVPYGSTKLAIENHLLLCQELHRIKAVILRVANAYGERQRVETSQGAIGTFLRRALDGRSLEIWGDGALQRDFLHVADVAEAFARAAVYPGPESIFNIGSGAGTSLNELIGVIEHTLHRTLDRRHLPGRPFDVSRNILDCSRARRELGWQSSVGLQAGIARTVAWLQAHPAQRESRLRSGPEARRAIPSRMPPGGI